MGSIDSDTMTHRVIYGAGPPPDYVEFRYCPKDPGHWKSEGERCPVCHTKIKSLAYIHAGEIEDE